MIDTAQEFSQLGNVSDITMGQSPDSASCNADERGLPFLQGCAEFGKQSPLTEMYCSPPLRVSKADSILISVRAPVGKLNWGEQSYCIGRGLGAIKAKAGLSDTRFLSYAIDHNVAFLHRKSQGSTFLAIGANDLKIFPIPVFSYKEQQKISWVLKTIEKTEALIERYQHIKAVLMHDLFTRGITADGKLRPTREQAPELYQETPIGWIPKEWQYDLLDKLADRKSGHTPNRNHPEYRDGGIKWISLADSRRLDSLYIDETDFEISQQGITNSLAVLLPDGVGVMSRDAGGLFAGLVSEY